MKKFICWVTIKNKSITYELLRFSDWAIDIRFLGELTLFPNKFPMPERSIFGNLQLNNHKRTQVSYKQQ